MAKEVKNIDPGHKYGPTIPLSRLPQRYTLAHPPRAGDVSLLNSESDLESAVVLGGPINGGGYISGVSPLSKSLDSSEREDFLNDEYLKNFPFTD